MGGHIVAIGGGALHFAAGALVEAVCAREDAGAYRVQPGAETPVPTRLLG